MDETSEVGFNDFLGAMFDGDIQTGSDTETEATEADQNIEPEDATQDGVDEPESEKGQESEYTDEHDESGAEDGSESDSKGAQMFTLKVNKEEKQVTLDEMTDLARRMTALEQQGLDFQTIKEQKHQVQQLQQTNTELQGRLDGMAQHQEALDVLGLLAERTGSSILDLTNTLYINFRKTSGTSEDAAKLELENARLKKQSEAASAKAEKEQQQDQDSKGEERVQRDLEEFRREYPDVELTNELLDKLAPDIEKDMSLSAAYRKMERAEEKERMAEMERKLAAAMQNAKNKRNTPGSQKDSGGATKKTDFDKFFEAFSK